MAKLGEFLGRHSRVLLVTAWLLAPVALLGLHYGPGQRGVAADRIAGAINIARAAEASEDWAGAVAAWRNAIAEVPVENSDLRVSLTLEYQMARVMAGQLPEAMEETAALLDEARALGVRDETRRKVRAKLAAMHYWAAWLMRLEGAAASEWEPVADFARQHFRLLAETESGDEHKRNLEATIRLQRMDLSQLQALPLPKECKGQGDCSGKCKGQRQGRLKNQGQGASEDARDDVQEEKAAGAGVHNRSKAAGW